MSTKALENDDLPASLLTQVKDVFGANKRFTFLIPSSSNQRIQLCLASQDAGGAKSHYGAKYKEMSDATGGGIG